MGDTAAHQIIVPKPLETIDYAPLDAKLTQLGEKARAFLVLPSNMRHPPHSNNQVNGTQILLTDLISEPMLPEFEGFVKGFYHEDARISVGAYCELPFLIADMGTARRYFGTKN